MPQTLAIGNIVELKVFNRLADQVAINVFHFRVTATGGGSITDQQACDGFAAGVAPLYKTWMPSTALHLGVRLQIIQPLPTPVFVKNTTNAGVGAVASDGLAPATCICVTKRTALAGRQFRGRMYLPFFTESQNDPSGVPTAGATNDAAGLANYILSQKIINPGAGSATLFPVVYRRVTGNGTDVVSYTVRGNWATQRRRSNINKADSFAP